MKNNLKSIEEIVKSFCKYFDWEEDSEQAHSLRQALQQYGESVREEAIKIVNKQKARVHECDSEAFGYELLEDFKVNQCCPGDDASYGFEKACDEILKDLSTKKDNQECNCETHPEHGKLHTQECVLETLDEKDNQ